ncbi:MAG: hypothetical protein WBP02_13380, partial [Gammaproteobacteria bacterium]
AAPPGEKCAVLLTGSGRFCGSGVCFHTLGQLPGGAQARRLLTLQLDEKSGGYIIKKLVRED